MDKLLILKLIICIIFTIIIFLIFIPILKKMKFGQSIREDGPRNHLIKNGTPTMGGIIIIFCSCISYIILMLFDKSLFSYDTLLLVVPFVGYGLIGLLDDLLIIIKKKNEGLTPKIKFLLELLVGIIYYLVYLTISFDNKINFFGTYIDFGFLYGVIITLLFSGFTNATNFTDGIDGLLGSTSITSFIGIGILANIKGNYSIMYLCIAIIITLIAFLLFNFPKAGLFMGDTGSLAIGGAMISMLIKLKCEILIIFFGFIYFVELFSVMLQVWYFKRTKGKRILKMAPIHHHMELNGYNEYQLDLLFSVINLLFVVIGIMFGVSVFE